MKSHRCSLISLRPNESTNDPPCSESSANRGFGSMPQHSIEAELASGPLIEIKPDHAPPPPQG